MTSDEALLMVRICWRCRDTGVEGHGEPITKSAAHAWLADLSNLYPGIDHWLEAV